MRAERLPAGVAVEERRENAQRQRRGEEERILAERREDHVAELAPGRAAFRDLHVVLRLGRLMAGGDAAIDPFGLVENLPRLGDLFGREDIGNSEEHGIGAIR